MPWKARVIVPNMPHLVVQRGHIATTSMGMSFATVAGAMRQFGLLLMLLPLQVLSGRMTPRESMPEIIQNTMLFAPNTHFTLLPKAIWPLAAAARYRTILCGNPQLASNATNA